MSDLPVSRESDGYSRRAVLGSAFAAAGAVAAMHGPFGLECVAQAAVGDAPKPGKRYAMKKSINQWAFPYPDKMSIEQCLKLAKAAGFDAIELNYDLDNDLSPKSGTKEYTAIRQLADKIGIQISGICSFLFWPYPFTSHDPAKRARALELQG